MDCYHQQVATGHSDDTDVREGLEDVIQGRRRKGQHLLRGVLGDALMNHL